MANEQVGERRLIIAFIIIIVVAIIVILVVTLLYNSNRVTRTNVGCSTTNPPLNVSVISVNIVTARVSWTSLPGVSKHRIFVGTISGFNTTAAIQSQVSTTSTADIIGLILGRTYYFKVAGINACDEVGTPSGEVVLNLSYPAKFRIVSRLQPALALKINGTFEGVTLQPICSGGDNLCVWRYNASMGAIVSDIDPLNCMLNVPANIDTRLKYASCTDDPYGNVELFRQWIYDPSTGSLCNPPIFTSTSNCLKINGPAINGAELISVPYDGTASMKWDIIQVV